MTEGITRGDLVVVTDPNLVYRDCDTWVKNRLWLSFIWDRSDVDSGATGLVIALDFNAGSQLLAAVAYLPRLGPYFTFFVIHVGGLQKIGGDVPTIVAPPPVSFTHPHVCPFCGSPAYIGLDSVDCSKNCQKKS